MPRAAVAIFLAAALLTVAGGSAAAQGKKPAAGSARYTLNTPVKTLLKDPRSRAVVARHFPGLVGDSHLWMYDHKGLKEIAAYPGSSLPRQKLQQAERDLARIR